MLTQKNVKAYAVLAIVMDRMGDDFEEVTIEPYLNGRESGFALWRYSSFEPTKVNKAVFSEFRSGGLVVYTGRAVDFDMAGNMPSEQTYRRKTIFGEYAYDDAAIAVIAYLAS